MNAYNNNNNNNFVFWSHYLPLYSFNLFSTHLMSKLLYINIYQGFKFEGTRSWPYVVSLLGQYAGLTLTDKFPNLIFRQLGGERVR